MADSKSFQHAVVLNVMDASGKCKGVLTRKISLVVIGTMLDYIPSVSSFLDFLLIPFNKVISFFPLKPVKVGSDAFN